MQRVQFLGLVHPPPVILIKTGSCWLLRIFLLVPVSVQVKRETLLDFPASKN